MGQLPGKIANVGKQVFLCLFAALFLVLFASLCFFNTGSVTIHTGLQLLFGALCAGALLAAMFAVGRGERLRAFLRARAKWLFIGWLALLVTLHCVQVAQLYSEVGWDMRQLVYTAMGQKEAVNGDVYFSMYPNNLFLLFCFRAVYLLARPADVYGLFLALDFINVMAIDLAVALTVLLANRCLGKRAAFATAGLCTMVMAVFPWVVIPYSDTFAMPFVPLSLLLYSGLVRAEKPRARLFWAVLLGGCLALGYLVKPTFAVVGIALLLHWLLALAARPATWRGALVCLLACLIPFALLLGGFEGVKRWQGFVAYDPAQQVPPAHFVAMGLQTSTEGGNPAYGGYSFEDVVYTGTFPTQKEKTAANLEKVRGRIGEMGAAGYMRFLLNKARWVTAEGYFYWGGEGGFLDYGYQSPGFWTELVYPGGAYYTLWLHYAQGAWIALWLFMLAGCLDTLRRGNDLALLCQIIVFGALLFLLVFEARSRYLLCFLPAFFLLAGYGAAALPFGKGRAAKGQD